MYNKVKRKVCAADFLIFNLPKILKLKLVDFINVEEYKKLPVSGRELLIFSVEKF